MNFTSIQIAQFMKDLLRLIESNEDITSNVELWNMSVQIKYVVVLKKIDYYTYSAHRTSESAIEEFEYLKETYENDKDVSIDILDISDIDFNGENFYFKSIW